MPAGRYTRAVGIRFAVLGTTHLQERDLDQGLAMGHQALNVLGRVRSARARGYILDLVGALDEWKSEPRVTDFIHLTRSELAAVT
ncbi:hypothetical protein [Kitasatospora sp. NPDC057015]|uniref:hypothetical protein n=1 Tax=Kitasatospora sp. NPDC057015 TaxID=3346001 RepID=UPI0036449885